MLEYPTRQTDMTTSETNFAASLNSSDAVLSSTGKALDGVADRDNTDPTCPSDIYRPD